MQHPHKFAAVLGIAAETVDVPAENALRFPALNAFDHGGEADTPDVLRGFLVFNDSNDLAASACRKPAQRIDLIRYGLDLARLVLGGFAGVENVTGHRREMIGRLSRKCRMNRFRASMI
ncbi:MAG: hypothetical protein PHZ00_06140 [Candidatus Peribacteraceae bacterium]|nr:hypothetical protein [Candidatus Peribacteraceae bacterium]